MHTTYKVPLSSQSKNSVFSTTEKKYWKEVDGFMWTNCMAHYAQPENFGPEEGSKPNIYLLSQAVHMYACNILTLSFSHVKHKAVFII